MCPWSRPPNFGALLPIVREYVVLQNSGSGDPHSLGRLAIIYLVIAIREILKYINKVF